MNLPQNISDRYVHSLLINGSNRTFSLMALCTHATIQNNVNLGTHYSAKVDTDLNGDDDTRLGYGATPLGAVRRALELWGVTFK